VSNGSATLAARFAALDLRASGRPIPRDEVSRVASEIAARVSSIGPPGRQVLLVNESPLAFVLELLTLIDHGHCPVPIGADIHPTDKASLAQALSGGSAAPGTYACLTSGTTSSPRLRVLAVTGARANASSHARSLGIGEGNVLLQSLPLHHSFGIVAYVFTALETGCALDLNPTFLTFRALGKRPPFHDGVLHVSPAHARFLLRDHARAPEGVAVVSVGAGICAPAELDELARLASGAEIFVTYGLTEAGPRVTTGRVGGESQGASARHGYVGRAIEGVELRVASEHGVARTGTGQLLVASPSLAKNLAPDELDEDAFLVTRDVVELTGSGEVVFLSRASDLLKVGGVSVYPRDVEDACRAHPAVHDCIVLRRSDPLYDDVFDLAVESTRPADSLVPELLERLTGVLRPKEILVFSSLPRTALGKIDRARLRPTGS
jgi:acyl-CoA synthetase (AMP-forming)/AMP-acid ligase II